MIKSKIMFKLLLFILFNIIVFLNLWVIGLLLSNSRNVIFYGLLFNIFGNFFLSILIGYPDIVFSRMNNLSFWFLPFSLFLFITSLFVIIRKIIYLLINLNLSLFSFIFFLGKKFKLSFYPIIIFFIIILVEENFSYVSCSNSNDLPLPNNGSPIEAIIVFIFVIIFAYISVNHNNYISKIDGSKNLNPLDLNETEKNLLESLPTKETNKISNLSLSDEILSNKFINLAIVVYCFFIICFVIYEYLYPKFTKKVISIKKLKKK